MKSVVEQKEKKKGGKKNIVAAYIFTRRHFLDRLGLSYHTGDLDVRCLLVRHLLNFLL